MINVKDRIKNLQLFMEKEKQEAILITKEENVKYFSGFLGDSSYLLVGSDFAFFITDSRYTTQAEMEVDQEIFKIQIHQQGLLKEALELLKQSKVSSLLIEGENLNTASYLSLQKELSREITITATEIDTLRTIKEEYEIENLKRACFIADAGFEYIQNFIKDGVSEIEIARRLEYFMGKMGSEKPAFDTIVASGKRGALPHGVASDKLIKNGEFVTIDFGAVYKGYHSDITRTVSVNCNDETMVNIYNIVLESQKLALELLKPNVKCSDVDLKVRENIEKYGFGEYFIHSLGHGIGLEIHENPRLAKNSNTILKPNMVVTNEPGIYIKGVGGVRIEDSVLITKTGSTPLTKSTKELIVL